MSGCDIKERFMAVHRRKPHSKFYAGDNTGWDIAKMLSEAGLPWEHLDPHSIFMAWKRGNTLFRVFSIEVRPLSGR